LAILFGAVFTAGASWAAGSLVLGAASREVAIRFVTGAAAVSLAVFLLCCAGLAYPLVFLALGAAVLFAARADFGALKPAQSRDRAAQSRDRKGAGLRRLHRAFLLLFAVFFVLYLANAMAPEFSFDGSRYHLGLVSRYLREHGFQPITDNLYASLTQGIEMLYVVAFAFGRHSAAATLHFIFLLALAWQVYRYAAEHGYRTAGICAAFLVFASPVVGVVGTSAYVDVAVAAIAFTLFHLLQLWAGRPSGRLLAAIGMVAGFAYAAKLTAWVAVPYALGFVAWKSRRLRDCAIVAAMAAVMIAPWLAKNWIQVGNPVAPFFNQVFPNPYVTVAFEREYRAHLEHYDLKSRWEIPMQVTTYGSLSGLLGPIFLLAPLALWSLRRPEGRQLLLAAAAFGATYFSNIGTRFLIPPLPFVALAMAIALAELPTLLMALVVVHAVLSWPPVVRLYSHADAWHLVKVPYREALRIKPEDGFLESNLYFYGATRMLDRLTPPGSAIFAFTPIPEAYTSRKVLVAYQSAGNIVDRDILWSGFVPDFAPSLRIRFRFSRRPLNAVRLVQTATGAGVWYIHELHLFDGARKLPRSAGWRAAADPYPWDIGNILDGRLVTFWKCGDTLRPGETVDVNFGSPETADALEIETAPNQPQLGLRLEGRGAAGPWTPLAAAPEFRSVAAGDLRRAATELLKQRGVDYLLLFDGEFGAGEFQRNAAAWGMREIGKYKGARLYQLP
jgi:hypothetical protein